MRGNSQNGGQTTKSLLIKPQCSGVPIQQAVSLSSSFPRHCLLFVCAFFRKMQAGARSEELPLSLVSCIQNRPGFHHGNRGDSFALWVLFSGAHTKPCEGSFGKPRVCGGKGHLTLAVSHMHRINPAYAGKRESRQQDHTITWDHPRVCGEKARTLIVQNEPQGSPPRMRGKD